LGTVVWTERTSLAEDLWRYGEDDLWKRVLTASDQTMEAIGRRAMDHLLHGQALPSGGSMLISKALALAAVEVLEGVERPLRRSRRRPRRDFPGQPPVRSFIARRWFDRRSHPRQETRCQSTRQVARYSATLASLLNWRRGPSWSGAVPQPPLER
jgi:hypothetical protein